MDPGTLLAIAKFLQSLLPLLDSPFWNKVVAGFSFAGEARHLEWSMSTIIARLQDAEEDEKNHIARSKEQDQWLGNLRNVVRDAVYLFDEIAYRTRRKEIKSKYILQRIKKVLPKALKATEISKKIENIRKDLDRIAKDHHDFGSSSSQNNNIGGSSVQINRQTHSFVPEKAVIGRDNDKKEVLDMLLDSNVQEDVHFVAIIGIGGVGKTTLAKLVFNDENIKGAFQLRKWVCVSDDFNLRSILSKILGSVNNQVDTLEELQCQVGEMINGKKYLLVLDDVWNDENGDEWSEVNNILARGKGSRVVVTTRSKTVANIIPDSCSTYELKCLSPKDSWKLFKELAFKNEAEKNDERLVKIGEKILKKCHNVPLAIKVAATALRTGRGEVTWRLFENIPIAKIDKDKILPILKLSYYHLDSPLKSCFNYCALFPKYCKLTKQQLISMWIAHGFIEARDGQSVEDVGEDYFTTLLDRCFFQDVKIDNLGSVQYCKVHDLMHDMALDMIGKDIQVKATSQECKSINNKARYLFWLVDTGSGEKENPCFVSCLSEMKHLHTIILNGMWVLEDSVGYPQVEKLISKARYIRVLSLVRSNLTALPSSIEELVLLKYLDLSHSKKLEKLPDSLCSLIDLQTLHLNGCESLKELPSKLSQLTNLRNLDTIGCSSLTHMPVGMRNLTSLHRLSRFFVKPSQSRCSNFEDLKALTNLRGSLSIEVNGSCDGDNYVKGMEHLERLFISVHLGYSLGCFEPHPNLQALHLNGYDRMPNPKWVRSMETSLPYLVQISLLHLSWKHLPLLGRLRHLRILEMAFMGQLEYMEQNYSNIEEDSNEAFFPSLEILTLKHMPEIKEWRRISSSSKNILLHPTPYSFPRLLHMDVFGCPKLTCVPLSSNLKTIKLCSIDGAKQFDRPFELSCTQWSLDVLLIQLERCQGLSLSIVVDSFWHHISTLSRIDIQGWSGTSSLSEGGLEHLTRLQELSLCDLPKLEKLEDGNSPDHKPWNSLTNLRILYLRNLPSLANLPQGIKHLTSLQTLHINRCNRLTSFPEAMWNLTSITKLEIINCRGLEETYQHPSTSEDWLNLLRFHNNTM